MVDELHISQRHEDMERKWEYYHIIIFPELKKKIKSVAYNSQGSCQLDFCNWLADGSTTE